MRGRDNGLPDYNTIRKYFNFPPVKNWSEINPLLYEKAPELFEILSRLYDNNLDNIDVYVGGMVESELDTGRPGPLFRAIIREQFLRIRDADRFWFENKHNGVFSEEEIEEIRKIKLWDIIVNATNIPTDAIQKDLFLFRPDDPCPQPRQMTIVAVVGYGVIKLNNRQRLKIKQQREMSQKKNYDKLCKYIPYH
ncbi:hypothetical protein BLA29_009342 [Euroglyphus maynei]|uniref:Uncharacterized protein n=1 Tax=Euroglyphus maynei TaxID=6958 RepID=A0A1Y3APF0_EURMA|nr:hypothetical protein BLA29_009342 [Euroglyphus maynei]